ncbi:hypothetical protein LLS1_03010 [Leifsonia sp. LS1]|uniref:RCC1 domain-containing protein n=1 Tax=Leifsonia sp. LS1 TaxID=2828483 RepID=UPI001CFD916C|nr:hypothetical protein [Leifsonia sp. LS1]GIT78632.1 hypothetical protein LLS1_03010 [Leifsonia sp. LS1]
MSKPSPVRRRRLKPALLGLGGVAVVAALITVGATGADFTDRGQFNYLVTMGASTSSPTSTPTQTPTSTPTQTPTTPPGSGNGVPTQNFSNVHSLARAGGTLYGWAGGQASGVGTYSDSLQQVRVPAGTTFTEIALGPKHNLAIDQNGDIWGWGYGQTGALGSYTDQPTPVKIVSTATKYRKVAAGGYINLGTGQNQTSTSYAIDTNGNLWSWGAWNGGAQTRFHVLGDSASVNRNAPKQITTGIDFVDVSVGWDKNMAVARDGSVYAWGSNHMAGLALSDTYSTSEVVTPTRSPYLSNIVKVAMGGRTAYALDRDGYVWSWGSKSGTQSNTTLGLNPTTAQLCKWSNQSEQSTALSAVCKPLRVGRAAGQAPFTNISAGESHFYALDANGAVWAWGGNRFGNTGIGTTSNGTSAQDTLSPTKVDFSVKIAAVAAEYFGGVAVDVNGGVWAWGRTNMNTINLLGDGRSSWSSNAQTTPKKVK